MIEPPRRKRVLIVGAGRRVQNNFLPAFRCLADLYEVCGVHSRTPERVRAVARKWDVPAVVDLADFDLSSVDLVAISVPTAQNSVVLEAVLSGADHLRILIDTPIAWNLEEIRRSRPLLEQFSEVTVAEDYMNFPAFSLVRDATIQGLIGRPRSLSLFNIGYLYHGLALIRSFVGFDHVARSWRKPLGGLATIVGYEFADQFSATVIGPYRRHEHPGGLFLEGSHGIITESSVDAGAMGQHRKPYLLQAVRDSGVLTGYRLKGPDRELTLDLPHFQAMRKMDFPDKSEINLVRGCGLIDVIRSIFHDRNLNRNYGFENAFYDSITSQRADRGEPLLDPARPDSADGSLPRQWHAKTTTYLKSSTKSAAVLPESDKILVQAGDVIEADHAEPVENHTALRQVRLNGQAIGRDPWFIFTGSWQPL